MVKKTTEQFIKEAKAVHGDRYDYSLTKYDGTGKKVKIICSVHGEKEVWPRDHLNGRNCQQCVATKNNSVRKKTTEEFIEQARAIHGGLYNYSLTNCNGMDNMVTIICAKHGNFDQRAADHLKGSGCNKCKNSIENTEEFIQLAQNVHGKRYDYSKTWYTRTDADVCIICAIHGEFWQRAAGHLAGRGCQECGKIQAPISNTLSQEEVLLRFKNIHGNRYDYSLVDYNKNYDMVTIICIVHGSFDQRAADHWNGHGCKHCFIDENKKNYSKSCSTWLNIIAKYKRINIRHAENGGEHSVVPRYHGLEDHYPDIKYVTVDGFYPDNNVVFEFHGCLWHGCPVCYSPEDANPITKKSMKDLYARTKQKEELLDRVGFEHVIVIWEHEWWEIIRDGLDPSNNSKLKKYLDSLDF